MSEDRRPSYVQGLATRAPVAKLSSELEPELWHTAYASGAAVTGPSASPVQEQAYNSDKVDLAHFGDSPEEFDEDANGPQHDESVRGTARKSDAGFVEDDCEDEGRNRDHYEGRSPTDKLQLQAITAKYHAAVKNVNRSPRLVETDLPPDNGKASMGPTPARQEHPRLVPETTKGMTDARRRRKVRQGNLYGSQGKDEPHAKSVYARQEADESSVLARLVDHLNNTKGKEAAIPVDLRESIFGLTGKDLTPRKPLSLPLTLDTNLNETAVAKVAADAASTGITITSTTAISTSALAVGAAGGAIGSAITLFAKLFALEQDTDAADRRKREPHRFDLERKALINELDKKLKIAAAKAGEAENDFRNAEQQFKSQLHSLEQREARLIAAQRRMHYEASNRQPSPRNVSPGVTEFALKGVSQDKLIAKCLSLQRAEATAREENQALQQELETANSRNAQMHQRLEDMIKELESKQMIESRLEFLQDRLDTAHRSMTVQHARIVLLEFEKDTLEQSKFRHMALHFAACAAYAKLKKTSSEISDQLRTRIISLKSQLAGIVAGIQALPETLWNCNSGHPAAAKIDQLAVRQYSHDPEQQVRALCREMVNMFNEGMSTNLAWGQKWQKSQVQEFRLNNDIARLRADVGRRHSRTLQQCFSCTQWYSSDHICG